MGDIVSTSLHSYPLGFGQEITSTNQKDWITKHAELSRLSIVECERLWARFQQLGCDDDGVLHTNHLSQDARYKEDVLMRNLLLVMVGRDKVYFHTFLNAMWWVNNASIDEKSKAIFSFFNNGNTLGKELFTRVLKRIYPGKDEETVSRYAKIVLEAGRSDDDLTYENFLRICIKLPIEQLAELLRFDVLPAEIAEEANMRFSPLMKDHPGEASKNPLLPRDSG